MSNNKRPISSIEKVGMFMVFLSLFFLLWKPAAIGGLFSAMFAKAAPIVLNVYVAGPIGAAIIISVAMGRILERLGFTDALMRIFVPLMRYIGVNAAIAIPSIYNILGDVNAAGRIAGPILQKAGATKDEQKIAIATMMQNPSSFSILVFGIIAMANAKVSAFPVIILGVFLPVIIVPLILKLTIWRNTRPVKLEDLPTFTPNNPFLSTVFTAGREGAEVLYLLIVPACAIVFAFLGMLDYWGLYKPLEYALSSLMVMCNIHPETGVVAIFAGGTLALAQIKDIAVNIPPGQVVGLFILASSSPLQVIFGQIPAVWSGCSDLNEREAMVAAIIGAIIKLITAAIFAWALY